MLEILGWLLLPVKILALVLAVIFTGVAAYFLCAGLSIYSASTETFLGGVIALLLFIAIWVIPIAAAGLVGWGLWRWWF